MSKSKLISRIATCACLAWTLTLAGDASSGGAQAQEVPLTTGRNIESEMGLADIVGHGKESLALPFAQAGQMDVLLAVSPGAAPDIVQRVRDWNGTVAYREDRIGYLRLRVAQEHWAALSRMPGVEALRLDGPNTVIYWAERDLRPQPKTGGADAPAPSRREQPREDTLPILTAEEARKRPFTTDHVVGLDRLRQAHPTFDGRGVTIALLEPGAPALDGRHASMASALSIDGKSVPKIARLIHAEEDTSNAARVTLRRRVRTSEWIAFIDGNRYELPRAGEFNLGTIEVASRVYSVLWEPGKRAAWVDTNQNGNFRDELLLRDANLGSSPTIDEAQFNADVGWSTRRFCVAFDAGGSLWIQPLGFKHVALSASIAAGVRDGENLAVGAAPAARLVLVDSGEPEIAHQFIEALIATARSPEVDLISIATVMVKSTPETPRSLMPLLMDRIIAAYGKPIVVAAQNTGAPEQLNPAGTLAITVGASADRETAQAYNRYSGTSAEWVWSYSSHGPTAGGVAKPDVVAPPEHIVAARCAPERVPNLARFKLPPCYTVGGGTSGSTPFVAGLIASLMSGARQQGLTFGTEDIRWALRESAGRIEGVQTAIQGTGIPQADKAWALLLSKRTAPEPARRYAVNHALAAYRDRESIGNDELYEREGWTVGQRGQRHLTLTRRSGAPGTRRYNVVVAGDTEVFASRATIALPLNEPVTLPVSITARTKGLHSALISVREPASGALLLQRQVAIVAAETFTRERGYTLAYRGAVDNSHREEHAFKVEPGTHSLVGRVEVTHDTWVWFYEPAGWTYHRWNVRPFFTVKFLTGPAVYEFEFPAPAPGTWMVVVANRMDLPGVASTDYSIHLRARQLHAEIENTNTTAGTATVNWTGHPGEPVVDDAELQMGLRVPLATTDSQIGSVQFADVFVRPQTTAVTLRAAATAPDMLLSMYLYDCTQDTCRRYDAAIPDARQQAVTLKNPRAGRWRLVVVPDRPVSDRAGIDAEAIVVHPDHGAVTPASVSGQARETLRDGKRSSAWSYNVDCRTTSGRDLVFLVDSPAKREVDRTAARPVYRIVPDAPRGQDDAGELVPTSLVVGKVPGSCGAPRDTSSTTPRGSR